jgi:hypothetical protein
MELPGDEYDADLSWPARVVNPAWPHGYSSPIVIVCERLHGVLTAKRVFAAGACGRKFLHRSHAPTYPRVRRDADNGNLSGSAVRDRDPPIRDYLQKTDAI